MGTRLALAAVLLWGCNAKLGPSNDQPDATLGQPDGSGSNNQVDGGLGLWSEATAVTGAADPAVNQDDVTLNSTLTELYFKKTVTGNANDLFWMRRNSPTDPWGQPVALTQLNTTATEESPRLSPDDLTLYFGRAGDIYKSTRADPTAAWGAPVAVTEVNTTAYEKWLAVCGNNYFMVSRGVTRADATVDQDLFVGRLDGTDAGTLSSALSTTGFSEISSFLSTDCKTAMFSSNRNGSTQIFMATRSDAGSPFGAPTLYEEFGTATDDEDPWMSADQRTFYLASIRGTGVTTKAIYVSTR